MEERPIYGKPSDNQIGGTFLESYNVRQFRRITTEMAQIYKDKNKDYGNSFEKRVLKYGLRAALTHIAEKFDRIESLILQGDANPNYESLEDSITDLANFSIMTLMVIQERNNAITEVEFENESKSKENESRSGLAF